MQPHRKDCLSAIKTYVDTVKLTAVADVLHHMVSAALSDEDGHRIPLAGLRTHMVAISRHFITAITRMRVDKISLPLYPSIENRLATDMASYICKSRSCIKHMHGNVALESSRPLTLG